MKEIFRTSFLGWAGRIGSLAAWSFLLMFMIGEGYAPWRFTSLEFLHHLFFPLGLMAGLLLGWRWELVGGAVSVLSVAGFYALHYASHGRFPGGPFFILLTLPGVLFLCAGIRSKLIHPLAASQ